MTNAKNSYKIILINLLIFTFFQFLIFFVYKPRDASLAGWDYEIYSLLFYFVINIISLKYAPNLKYKIFILYTVNAPIYAFIAYFLIISYEHFLISVLILYLFIPLVSLLLHILFSKITKT